MLRIICLLTLLIAFLTACSRQPHSEPQPATTAPIPARAGGGAAAGPQTAQPPSPSAQAEADATQARSSAPSLTPEPWAAAPTATGVPAPTVTAAAVAVLDEASGSLLYGRDSERPLPPASLTKIATAVLALERGSLEESVAIGVDSRTMKSSTVMGLLPGDRFTLGDLLYGLMLPSGNDAALAIGRHLAGSDVGFVAEMNSLAQRLRLTRTRFANAHGLSARGHASSAHDLAILARHAMSIPEFRQIAETPWRVVTGSRTLELSNLNPFLYSYPGADGVKTGYTWRSGRTMLVSAVREGHRVYVVLLNAPEMEKDAQALMDWAFTSFRWP